MRRAIALGSASAGVGILLLSGCTSGASNASQQQSPSASPTHSHLPENVTTINGKIPPERASESISDTRQVNAFPGNGNEIEVFKTIRAEGTRAPIHQHPEGGTTCVHKGQMTLYLEGAKPQVANAGQCYWMPPGRNMTGVNSGKGNAVMFDIFTTPQGDTEVWEVVEKGQEGANQQFHRH